MNAPVKDVQADEIWRYVSKEAHKFPFDKGTDPIGDAYCHVAMERHSKLIPKITDHVWGFKDLPA